MKIRKSKKLGETTKRHAEKMWNLIVKRIYWGDFEKQLRSQLKRDIHILFNNIKYMKNNYYDIENIADSFANSYCGCLCNEENHKDFIEDYGHFVAHGGSSLLGEQQEYFKYVFERWSDID